MAIEVKTDMHFIKNNITDFVMSCLNDIDWCLNNLSSAILGYSNTGNALEYK